MVQGNLFEREDVKITSKGLTITTHQKNILSKQQQAFNRLIKRIETLRLDLEQVNKILNEKLDFYGKHIYPLQQQLIELKKELLKLLYVFFKEQKVLSKKERAGLKAIISAQLEIIFQSEKSEPDDELKQIFKELKGKSYEEVVEEEFGRIKDDMEAIFEDFGFDVDLDDFHSKMTSQEMMEKMLKMEEQFRQQANQQDQNHKTRKKTKKQQEKEEREKQIEEARTKNISSIYKQLAKALHPDLEQDEDTKLQKEELMKQLTSAYENNDLHTLLSLELAWIQKEENNPNKLTEDKLSIYNEVLREQVNDLEDEINKTFQHPRYQPLQEFATFSHQIKNVNFNLQKQQIEEKRNGMEKSVARLKNYAQALPVIKELIRDFEMQKRLNKDF